MSISRFLLRPESIPSAVAWTTLERGLAVYRNQQVLDFELFDLGGSKWRIEADVKGSGHELHEASVVVEVSGQGHLMHFSGVCSCPMSNNCKHCVALVLKAAYKSGAVRASITAAIPALSAAQAQARQQAQEQAARDLEHRKSQLNVTNWLESFKDDSPRQSVAPAASPGSGGREPDPLVYMLVLARQGTLPVLQLSVGRSRRLRNGQWGKVQVLRYLEAHGAAGADMEIIRLVCALRDNQSSYGYMAYQGILTGRAGVLALQMAAATGRLFSTSGERTLNKPIAWGPPRSLGWQWTESQAPHASEPRWSLRPQLSDANGATEWFGNSPPLYLDVQAGLCGELETPGVSTADLALFFKAPPIPQSSFSEHGTALLRRLVHLPLPPVLKQPEVLRNIKPSAHLLIEPVPEPQVESLGLLRATLRFDYAGQRHYFADCTNPKLIEQQNRPPLQTQAVQASGHVLLHRDLATEQSAQSALHALGLAGTAAGQFHLPESVANRQQLWLQWADAQFQVLRDAGFRLELDPRLANWISRADELEVQLTPKGGSAGSKDSTTDNDGQSPWFDLSLGIDINGQRHNILPLLPQLLSHLGANTAEPGSIDAPQWPQQVYLKQEDGTYLRLPTLPLRPWLQALLDLVGERGRDFDAGALRLSRLEAMRMGTALGEGARWNGCDKLRHMIEQLSGRDALPEIAAPDGLKAQLRPYQQQGLNWLQFLRASGLDGILADDMGLGKTVQTLAHLLVEKQAGRLDRPALIIAPVSVMGNWHREAARFTPQLKCLVLHGAQRHEAATSIADHDLVIAPYSLLQRDRERWLEQAWHLVVLDEAQNIKNANTHAARIVTELNSRHRLCLSGTPMENHLGELWSLFHFLMPGFLGSLARFKTQFRTPIEKHGDTERLDQLRRRITPFMLRRAKSEVATDLPEKQEAISSVELGDKQANLYETIRLTTEKAVRDALDRKGLAKSQIQILDALLKLRQVCCDPRLVPLPAAKKIKQSAKLELLMELLPEMLAEGRRVLLFSQFTSMLELIEAELLKRDIPWVKLTGQSQKRDALIERFTSGEVPLFLISLKAGGVGLNLTQADTVIHYDPWWNPAVETQATDRAHRIGQTQHVFVYKLVAQGTIEERILALQERKAALANSMYSQAAARKQPLFTEEDLSELLKPLGT